MKLTWDGGNKEELIRLGFYGLGTFLFLFGTFWHYRSHGLMIEASS